MANGNTKADMYIKDEVVLIPDTGNQTCPPKTAASIVKRCITTRSTTSTVLIQRTPARNFKGPLVQQIKPLAAVAPRTIAPAVKGDSTVKSPVISSTSPAVKPVRVCRPLQQTIVRKKPEGNISVISEKPVQYSGFSVAVNKDVPAASRNGQVGTPAASRPAIPAGLTITPINKEEGIKSSVLTETPKKACGQIQGFIASSVQSLQLDKKDKDLAPCIPPNASVFQKNSFFPKTAVKAVAVPADQCFPVSAGSKLIILGQPGMPTRGRPRGSRNRAEPVCLTLSSDDEDGNEELKSGMSLNIGNMAVQQLRQPQPQYCLRATHTLDSMEVNKNAKIAMNSFPKQNSMGLEMDDEDDIDESVAEEELDEDPLESSMDELNSSTEMEEHKIGMHNNSEQLVILCRSIRIGSYKVHPKEGQSHLPVMMTSEGFKFRVPVVKGVSEVQIVLTEPDLTQVLGHFGRCLPILFLFPSSACGLRIRRQLHMIPGEFQYFNPDGEDDRQKIITFLIETISDDAKSYIRNNFPGENKLKEVDQKLANEILVKSTPQQPTLPPPPIQQSIIIRTPVTYVVTGTVQATPTAAVPANPVKGSCNPVSPAPVTKIVTYPPPPQTGGITITSEDIACLQEGEFLNDVIIDFYLKYLMNEKLTETDRNRTHVFSSFFYPRLTQKSTKSRAGEEGMNTMAVRRHAQVRTWTKNVDIFEKDFIIVPINQNVHWFLAIICYPGLVPESAPAPPPTRNSPKSSDCVTSTNDGETCDNPESSQLSGGQAEEGPAKSTSDQACCTEDQSSDDGSSFSNDVDSSFADDSVPDTPDSSTHPDQARLDKMPCILIFDSLCGPNRARIVNTLREYLQMEWKIKKNTARSFSKTSITGHVISVPQQTNYSDCGIYVLQYVESFFDNPFPYFGPRMPDMKEDEWFPSEKVKNKRVEIRNLILELRNRQLSSMANRAGPTGKESDKTSATSLSASPAAQTKQSIRSTSS